MIMQRQTNFFEQPYLKLWTLNIFQNIKRTYKHLYNTYKCQNYKRKT